MTLVAGYVDKSTRTVHMMADSHSYDSSRVYPNVHKIVRRPLSTPNGSRNGVVLIGSAGEHAATWIARNAPMPTPTFGQNPQDVIDQIALSLQQTIADTPGPINDETGSIWLVGWNGHLWSFVHYDIVECDPFGAIGVADDLAHGAFRALYDRTAPNPNQLLTTIGEICANASHLVRPPFIFEHAEGVTRTVEA